MRKLFMLVAAAAGILATGLAASAASRLADVTITGEAVCAKCALKETPSCQNVVVVKEDGKEVKYYLAKNKASNDYHGKSGVCTASADSPIKTKVVGAVVEKDGKKEMTATTVEKVD